MSVFYTIFCFLATFLIIQLAPTFYGLPIFQVEQTRTRITVQVGLIAATLAVIMGLCVAQCIDIDQVHQGIGPSLTSIMSLWNWRNVYWQMTSSFCLSLKGSWPSCTKESMFKKYSSTFTFSPPLSPHFFFLGLVHPPRLHVVNGNRRNGLRKAGDPCRWYCPGRCQLPPSHHNPWLRLHHRYSYSIRS